MSISERISSDTKDAMRSRDRQRLGTLRMLSSALHNAEIESQKPLSEEAQHNVLRRQLKQREEAAESYRKANREEQAAAEEAEAEIIREYLPAPLSRDELEEVVQRAISETGAQSMKDMGPAMNRARELAGGRAEGSELAALMRARLG